MELSKAQVLIVGCGNMGGAMAKGFGALELGGLSVYDIDIPTATAVAEEAETDVTLFTTLEEGMKQADVIILAVKPQSLPQFLTASAGLFREGQILISILAGVTISRLREGLRVNNDIVRAMPNTPALVDEGLTALCGGSETSLDVAERLFDCVGEVIVVDESKMDAVTAVSGSGPAYVFYFIEAFVEAAKAQGFSDDDANALILQTLRGALTLIDETGESPAELRKKVTSPGGTTQAAIETLQRLNFSKAIAEAVAAAARRSVELGK